MIALLEEIPRTIPEDAAERLHEFAELPEEDPHRPICRERCITEYLPLAGNLCHKFRNRGENPQDLFQVAIVGLIKAIDGFDVNRQTDFLCYAVPTITGEIKRHFRDRTWDVRVPRRIQETTQHISGVVEELTQTLHRSPSVADLAEHLEIKESEVAEGLQGAQAYNAVPLDIPAGSEDAPTLAERLGEPDSSFDEVEYRVVLGPLLSQLPEREQHIVALRFFGEMTQAAIGEEMGLSQMHVSRLLHKALETLRRGVQMRRSMRTTRASVVADGNFTDALLR